MIPSIPWRLSSNCFPLLLSFLSLPLISSSFSSKLSNGHALVPSFAGALSYRTLAVIRTIVNLQAATWNNSAELYLCHNVFVYQILQHIIQCQCISSFFSSWGPLLLEHGYHQDNLQPAVCNLEQVCGTVGTIMCFKWVLINRAQVGK